MQNNYHLLSPVSLVLIIIIIISNNNNSDNDNDKNINNNNNNNTVISLAYVSSETHNLQRVFLRIYDIKRESLCQAFLAETVETGNKNRCVMKPRMFCEESLGKIKFRAFPKRVGPRILLLRSVE